jgi:hypothetical protein
VVRVAEEPGVHLRHAGEQALLVGGEGVPRPHDVERVPRLAVDAGLLGVGVQGRQLGIPGEDAHLLLAVEHELAVALVAHVESALVLLDPLLGRVVGGVGGAGAEVHEERLVGRDHLRVLDELNRPVGEVGREVVALLGGCGLVHRVVVVDRVRIPLVGLAAQEPVVALEAAADGPVPLRRCHVHLVGGDQVPLAEHVGVPAALAEDLGDRGALERNVAVGVREPAGGLGDAGHAVGGVVASGEQRRPRR